MKKVQKLGKRFSKIQNKSKILLFDNVGGIIAKDITSFISKKIGGLIKWKYIN